MRLTARLTTLALATLLAGPALAQTPAGTATTAASPTVAAPSLHAPILAPAHGSDISLPSAPQTSSKAKSAKAVKAPKTAAKSDASNGATGSTDHPMEVTADDTLEYYQDAHIYVARGHARVIRGELVVDADLVTAHEREKPKDASKAGAEKSLSASTANPGSPPVESATTKDQSPQARDTTQNAAVAPGTTPGAPPPGQKTDNGTGDIDIMTAEGNVRITDTKSRTTGEKAVYNLDKHNMVITGNNLRYETEKQVVTAKDALEYYEDKKIAVARGHAVEDDAARHVEGDVLTAEFADNASGQSELQKLTAEGHVKVVTKTDTVFGDSAVYDTSHDLAIIKKNVRITRPDGTQLTGDMAEVDFKTNQSRLLNSGSGRVRALLPVRDTDKGSDDSDTKDGSTSADDDKTAAKDAPQ